MTKIILKDGGSGQELLARSSMPAHPLWSTKVMMEEPEIVQAVHADFIRAGARLITLNTYSATPERLTREGVGDMFEALQQRAIDLASAARDEVGAEGVKLAACLPPLHGSYRPDMSRTHADLLPAYQEIAEAQAAACDVMLCETLSSVAEATAAAQAGVETGKPTWVFVTLKDDNSAELRSGEALSAALEALADFEVAGIGLNCSKPEVVSDSLHSVLAEGRPTGAYANGFTGIDALEIGGTVDELRARDDVTPKRYVDFAMQWIAEGARFVGGCCEVGPDHIAALANRLNEAGYELVGA
ncbi:homocysteine S-methyltransferase family protein [Shimia sp. R10_1]|uniref:homocysteine S-methyltransferase family protein n=1 Tax=Shimia sp. R10_1 TaxID=2821095 RepID=UPI001ADACE18|nr:homocysteine S-methyltransferase family protein [Shimia sp. R10_1]MBO9472843.1 homocysteine S-methyltransferase family protein [Shimia sp. R10_1]